MKRVYALLALLTIGCGGDNSPTVAPTPQPAPTPAAPTRIIALSAPVAFGDVQVGSSKTATLTISNTGNSTLTWTGLTGGFAETTVSSTSGTIPAGGNTTLTFRFAPTTAGQRNASLGITADFTSGTNTTTMSGNGVAAPAPTPTPSPTPTPTPSPSPAPVPSSGKFYVWGHDPSSASGTYTQYLGFFGCVFCQEFDSESINNEFGRYGSQFSSTSMRNQFGTWGSEFNSNSACNQFASSPPRVFNANSSVYYGELTTNSFRGDAIKTSSIVNWLAQYVCRH